VGGYLFYLRNPVPVMKLVEAAETLLYAFLWTILNATVRIGKRKGKLSVLLEQCKIEDE